MNIRQKTYRPLLGVITAVFFVGCYQGKPSEKPPIHLNPNMDNQPKYEAQEFSSFYEDGAAMRTPVEGTIARGSLKEDSVYYRGKTRSGSLVQKNPQPMTMANLKRGQQRFNIYCTPCHGHLGDGKGLVISRGYPPPSSFHDDRLRNVEDGHIFDVITNGLRNMPSYNAQIPVADRWSIVSYVRALQRSQNATSADVPGNMLDQMKGKGQ